jgi:hypothetical protein
MRCLLSSLILASALLSSASSCAQTNSGAPRYSITGTAEYAYPGGAAEKILVELRSGQGTVVAQTMTGSSGEFAFRKVESSGDTVTASARARNARYGRARWLRMRR